VSLAATLVALMAAVQEQMGARALEAGWCSLSPQNFL